METVPIALCTRHFEPPGLEIRINFGMLAGREATPAEVDELGKQLLPDVGEVSIVSEQRRELAEDGAEFALHQVRVEVAPDQLPDDEAALSELCGRLVERAEQWARACFAERHAEISEL